MFEKVSTFIVTEEKDVEAPPGVETKTEEETSSVVKEREIVVEEEKKEEKKEEEKPQVIDPSTWREACHWKWDEGNLIILHRVSYSLIIFCLISIWK